MQYKVPSELTCTADRGSAWRLDEVKLGNTLGFSSWQLAAPFSHRCAAIAAQQGVQRRPKARHIPFLLAEHTVSTCK